VSVTVNVFVLTVLVLIGNQLVRLLKPDRFVRPGITPPPSTGSLVRQFHDTAELEAPNRSLRSTALAASPSSGVTPKISCTVRRVELWV